MKNKLSDELARLLVIQILIQAMQCANTRDIWVSKRVKEEER